MTDADITGRRPTRTAETEAVYSKRLHQLRARHAQETGAAIAEVSAADLMRDIAERAHDLSAATLRQYTAAIRFGIETGRIATGPAGSYRGSAPRGRRRGRYTASLKAKGLSDRDLRRIDAALRRSTSRYARDLRAFLLANSLVGARVIEWRRAVFICQHPATGGPALQLGNAKATNGRSHGPTRTLHLHGLSRDAVTTIAACARWLVAREHAGTFAAWQAGAAKLLQRICRRLWPRRRRYVTLYSTRHRAASQYKALYDKPSVAAVMGHAALTTAGTHYARTARGASRPKPGARPSACEADVKRVLARVSAGRPRVDPPGPGAAGPQL